MLVQEKVNSFGLLDHIRYANKICRSYIPFSLDISSKLTPEQFKFIKSFLLFPFYSTLFSLDIQPAPFSTYSKQNHDYPRPANLFNIMNFVLNTNQDNFDDSSITRPLKYFVDQNFTNLATTELAVNIVIFAGNSLDNADIPVVQNYVAILTEYSNTVTVVLMNENIDEANYKKIFGLNIIVWKNSETTIADIRNVMNCGLSPSKSIPNISTESSANKSLSAIQFSVCKSYIPFSFDVSQELTAAQFADLKAFLVNQFLKYIFSKDIEPTLYSTYDSINFGYGRSANISDVINDIQNAGQTNIKTSDFNQPLAYFVTHGMMDLGLTNGLAVNSVIFSGSALKDVETATYYANFLTSNGNTLTVILMDPNTDQTNYQKIPGLSVIVWSDPVRTIDDIKNVMKCNLKI